MVKKKEGDKNETEKRHWKLKENKRMGEGGRRRDMMKKGIKMEGNKGVNEKEWGG